MEDTFESMEDGEEMEEAAEEEVDRILFDITAGDKNKITAQSHIFVFVCFGVFFREFKSEPQISYKVKTLKTLVLLSLVRCPWQSTEQSHRCPAWNGARWSHCGFRWRVRGGHWRDAVKIGSPEELRWTAAVLPVEVRWLTPWRTEIILVQRLQFRVSSSLLVINSHNHLGLTLCYDSQFFDSHLVYSARRKYVFAFCV